MARSHLIVIREPNGRISREALKEMKPMSPAECKRLRDMAIKGVADPEWGSELGRLFLSGKITAQMFEAGKRWGRLMGAYVRAIDAPAPDPKAANWFQGRTQPVDPDSDEGQLQARRDREIVLATQEAHILLCSAGKLVEKETRDLCERDRHPDGFAGLERVRTGLTWLGKHWGLIVEPKHVRLSP